ncbi:MAG: WecB/TagA/CpsF family glycosyltransferase [Alphaproteobacteria bacterium]|nr:WecB/TagA/CpsF family glycosyltransferase [Alphaproteobacteria bacterium]MBU1526358.1 WecB/TagA/CpsF family glycosyltransferase [Alphaproteobacteria bacterium]MBU2118204.1 WecB/TagA/CpsF family glycosyltransferase [Alphaproteobacteria bacterium]MBU2351497.1 WecB/TagA/CpsF family glycosyltransferase [Alphaproteobacteria bacterium]MBU2383331.1 WecB/TagA/CpsF family glycosyltransferase [Alphaproteobacteria bacterium]
MFEETLGISAALALPDRRRRARRPHRQARRAEERVTLLGETMDLVRPEEVMLWMRRWIQDGRKAVIANHNLHSLALLRSTPELRRFYGRADLVEVDSRPLLGFARLLKLSARPMHRCTYLDWREHFWSLADREGWRVFYLGGAPGVAEEAAGRIGRQRPRARIGTRHGHFDATAGSADNAEILREIADFQPNVLMVGMGMPRQELWIADHLDALPDCVVLNVGAAFDYEAGVQKAAPRWMGRLGVEWLFRLVADPKRLFHRYVVEPWALAGPAFKDVRQALTR